MIIMECITSQRPRLTTKDLQPIVISVVAEKP